MSTENHASLSQHSECDADEQPKRQHPMRERRVAEDFLVANAELYGVAKLFGGKAAASLAASAPAQATQPHAKKRRRTSETDDARRRTDPETVQPESSTDTHADISAPPSSSTPPPLLPTATAIGIGQSAVPAVVTLTKIPKRYHKGKQNITAATTTSTQTAVASAGTGACTSSHGAFSHHSSAAEVLLSITLSTLSGRQAMVRILSTRTLDELAARVEQLLGIPKDQIRLRKSRSSSNGGGSGADELPSAQCGPSTPLAAAGIQDGDVLIIRMAAGSTATGGGGVGADGGAAAFRPGSVHASPFKERVSLLSSSGNLTASGGLTPPRAAPRTLPPPSPYKDIPAWMKE